MNFFEAQAQARRNTQKLILLFSISLLLLPFCFYFILRLLLDTYNSSSPEANLEIVDYDLIIGTTVIILGIVFLGCLFKTLQLSGGGGRVATLMGGVPVLRETKNSEEKELFNIVEEMSIASGVPLPQIFVINDHCINAFAAGTTINNAAIAVTRGSLEKFNRDEMQGVIAHEFSHILNGDMRLNIRLVGIVSGLTLLSLLGRIMLYSGGGRGNNRGAIVIAGIMLLIFGAIGALMGSVIRMAISRQKEFLADASAVQFTRNPDGIGGALQKIGQHYGIFQNSNEAQEFQHMFFSRGVKKSFVNLFASHPPVEERIQAVLPQWDGKMNISQKSKRPAHQPQATPPPRSNDTVAALVNAVAAIQATSNYNYQYTKNPKIAAALDCSYSARALIYAVIINPKDEHGATQLNYLKQYADTGVYDLTLSLLPEIQNLPNHQRLHLLQLSIPPLYNLSKTQYHQFIKNIDALISLDGSIVLFEWCVAATITHILGNYFSSPKISPPQTEDLSYALSILARTTHPNSYMNAFNAAAKLNLPSKIIYQKKDFIPLDLYQSLQRLSVLPPQKKRKIVDAFIVCVSDDQKINQDEFALLHAFLMILDCPIPETLRHLVDVN